MSAVATVGIAMLAVFGMFVVGTLQLTALLRAPASVPAWARAAVRAEQAARGVQRLLGIFYSAAFAGVPQAVVTWSVATRGSEYGQAAMLVWVELSAALAWSLWLVRVGRNLQR